MEMQVVSGMVDGLKLADLDYSKPAVIKCPETVKKLQEPTTQAILDNFQNDFDKSAVKALVEAYGPSVAKLRGQTPGILSPFEQKAVAVLLTLLYLDVHNIHLGPNLPAFVSPNVPGVRPGPKRSPVPARTRTA